MSVFQPRARVVMFRLSETEYDAILSACESSGARSFSEFARRSVLARAGLAASVGLASTSVTELHARVHQLEEGLQSLTLALIPPAAMTSTAK